jgi:TPR repeat protein
MGEQISIWCLIRTKPIWFSASVAIGMALLSSACADQGYAMGISLAPDQAPRELQDLALRAQSGDKEAQLELGIRFEDGRGVPVDRARAMRLYAAAASSGDAANYVYAPALGRTKGHALALHNRLVRPGLAEAQQRLAALKTWQEQ